MSDAELQSPVAGEQQAKDRKTAPILTLKTDTADVVSPTAAKKLREAMEPSHRISEQLRALNAETVDALKPLRKSTSAFDGATRQLAEQAARMQEMTRPAADHLAQINGATRPMEEAVRVAQRFQDLAKPSDDFRAMLSSLQRDQERLGQIVESPSLPETPAAPQILENPVHETNRHLQTVAEVSQNQVHRLGELQTALAEDREARERKAEEDRRAQRWATWRQWLTIGLIAAGLISQVLM